MPSPLSIICPVGDKYGTAKSHALGVLGGYTFATQAEEDAYTAAWSATYIEVTHEEWALFALNARSMNVTGAIGQIGPHTLWRSSLPVWERSVADYEVGREASPTHLNTGEVLSEPKGLLPFVSLPWIFVGTGIDQPNPGSGSASFFFHPACYIFEGRFYIGISGFNQPPERCQVSGQTFTYYRTPAGTEVSVVFEITSTFYPTT
jgi:hypothetical protein